MAYICSRLIIPMTKYFSGNKSTATSSPETLRTQDERISSHLCINISGKPPLSLDAEND